MLTNKPLFSLLIPVVAVTLICTAVRAADAATTDQGPSEQQVRHELKWQIPSFWSLDKLEVTDSFFTDQTHNEWKARFQAEIKSNAATFFPQGDSFGPVKVLRKVYEAGEKRKLHGRLTAVAGPNGSWQFTFEFDNRVIKSVGLPLNYFVGPVVIEDTPEYDALSQKTFNREIATALTKHKAAMETYQRTYAAEVEALKQKLESLDDVHALRQAIENRIAALRDDVTAMNTKLDSLATDAVAQGPVLRQWASGVKRVSNPDQRDRYGAEEALGPPNLDPDDTSCRGSRPYNAWSAGRDGLHYIELTFLNAVIPTEVAVYEVNSPGFVRRLVFTGEHPGENTTQDVTDTTDQCPGTAVFPITGVTYPVRTVMIVVDTQHARNQGFESIDAVMLTGVVPAEKETTP